VNRYAAIFSIALVLFLQGCGTLYATAPNASGEEVMLLGYDPVTYFKEKNPVKGIKLHAHRLEQPSRIYYFTSVENKNQFIANPKQFEPQYGGFCASGAAYRLKLGSDPTEFEIVDGRLFIFGDILGKEMWRLFRDEHIRYADQVWPEIKERGWRSVTIEGYISKVPWYRTSKVLHEEFQRRNPGKTLSYDPGGMLTNLFLKRPGWRAAEGFGQPALGWAD
jgi:YHS domain-containing protein